MGDAESTQTHTLSYSVEVLSPTLFQTNQSLCVSVQERVPAQIASLIMKPTVPFIRRVIKWRPKNLAFTSEFFTAVQIK